jgi:hypothetical protein
VVGDFDAVLGCQYCEHQEFNSKTKAKIHCPLLFNTLNYEDSLSPQFDTTCCVWAWWPINGSLARRWQEDFISGQTAVAGKITQAEADEKLEKFQANPSGKRGMK